MALIGSGEPAPPEDGRAVVGRIAPAVSLSPASPSAASAGVVQLTTGGKHANGKGESTSAPKPRPSDARVEWVRAAVAKFERPLTQYASHVLGGDVDRARDLVQEAFLRLCDQDPAAVESHLAEWLYTVCRNLAIDAKRKDRRLRPMSDEQEASFAAGQESPTDAAERVDAYGRVVEAMASLPPRQQEIVRLKFQHGMSYKQIGEVMNLTATNVGFILHTAIKSLRGQLAAETNER